MATKHTWKTALISDLSGFGKCSLVADIAVLSAMGIEACPLPTAIYTAQTGFANYRFHDLYEAMPDFLIHWSEMDMVFDGILTGFFPAARHAERSAAFCKAFHTEQTLLLVDPVMADHGICYANYSEELLEQMRQIAKEADVLTPNISELCLLSGASMQDTLSLSGEALQETLAGLARSLPACKKQDVVITGVPLSDERIGNLIVTEEQEKLLAFPHHPVAYSGTGDLFAAVLLGSLLHGKSTEEAVNRAGNFLEKAVGDAMAKGVEGVFGTSFEKHLSMLW